MEATAPPGKELLRKIVDDIQAVCRKLLFFLFICLKCLFYFNTIFISEPFQSINIAILFMLHNEADRIATATATKTFVDFFSWRNCKGRSLFVMKRAKAKIVGASFFQFHKTAYDVYNIKATENFLYGIL